MAGLLAGDPLHHGVYEGGLEDGAGGGGRWYYSRKEIEENSISRRDGIDLKKETYLCKSYCTFLQDLGMRLKVFVGGLKPGIKPFVRAFKPTTVANSTVASSSAPSNPFGSGTALSTAPASPSTITPNSSSAAISNIFSSSWQTNKAPVMGSVASSPSPSTLFSFGASNTASTTSTFSFTSPTATSSALPSLSQSQHVFGSSTALRATVNSGDQMNMEDSMAEDPVHSSNPSVPVFGQPLVPPSNPTVPVFGQPLSSSSNPTVPAFGQSLVSPPSPPGFMFGSTAPQSVSPFQFGGQQNQAAPPIPSFQASNSGGIFSLGYGGGYKGYRKMVRISKNRNRKK